MFKIYKGHLITITKENVKDKYYANITIFYRYNFWSVKKYKHRVKLAEEMTLTMAYNVIKEYVDNLDKMLKL